MKEDVKDEKDVEEGLEEEEGSGIFQAMCEEEEGVEEEDADVVEDKDVDEFVSSLNNRCVEAFVSLVESMSQDAQQVAAPVPGMRGHADVDLDEEGEEQVKEEVAKDDDDEEGEGRDVTP